MENVKRLETAFRLGEKPSEAETDALMRWLNFKERLHTRCSEDVAPLICQLYGLNSPAHPGFQPAFLQVLIYGLRILMRAEPLRDRSVFYTIVGFDNFEFEIGIMVQHYDGDAWVQVLSGEECTRLAQQCDTVPPLEPMFDA